MTKIGEELRENAQMLRARETEDRWREARGLTKRLNRKDNAKPMNPVVAEAFA